MGQPSVLVPLVGVEGTSGESLPAMLNAISPQSNSLLPSFRSTEKKLGYNIDGTFENISGEEQEIRGTIQENLTYALVLVPVVCGMSFIAFLFSFGGTLVLLVFFHGDQLTLVLQAVPALVSWAPSGLSSPSWYP